MDSPTIKNGSPLRRSLALHPQTPNNADKDTDKKISALGPVPSGLTPGLNNMQLKQPSSGEKRPLSHLEEEEDFRFEPYTYTPFSLEIKTNDRIPLESHKRFKSNKSKTPPKPEETKTSEEEIHPNAFSPARLSSSNDYVLRSPSLTTPGASIDPHQKKHTPNWPVGSGSGRKRGGSVFKLTVEDTIELGQCIAKTPAFLKRPETDRGTPPTQISLPVEELMKKTSSLGRTLFSQKIYEVTVQSGYTASDYWAFHFHPAKRNTK